MDILATGSSLPSGQLISSKNIDKETAPPAAATFTTANTSASASNTVAPAAEKKTDPAQLKQAVKEINQALQSHNQEVRFSIDADSKRVIVKVVDEKTNQVLRQMPSQEALEISKSLDKLQGLLIKQQA
ncbi:MULTISPECIES: flagellar protein FlaG [unclassified Undibacterium]|uniref:flagellar protein FlaG n=1 Tax=unclassified Undibacterium TaxID=2630295 RepID=UPI002AC9A17E|nr:MULTISPECIES: flagellar protein FlaG [unclassified Undibacterium]MEB0139847.1 flagellar protein FlaG [Undibacterium sp. CCC2.1]MEB0172777.1 flagellar protein FlaG [Undibacterium sp. CCC1.1]MEB0176569.1 flagellar protein FlaG [Undibacterium sp. CCC3.4]MEB0215841.1 flagellar protein FlaG [Undibacterium sp. 5I2]WPX42692.1 flagellar protein FlaG [Undibacterium sp. CCC3.4]